MTDKQIIEYPHCKDCPEYFICKKKGLNRYRPKFLYKSACDLECAYDWKCIYGSKPYECPYYREWCYEDMEVAKELGVGGCYTQPLPSLGINIKSCIKEIIEIGEQIWKKINR